MEFSDDLIIGAVIPTHNRKQALTECLDAIRAQQSWQGFIKIIPIVIVDGSTDGTIETLSKLYPEAEIVNGNGEWWYTRCINEGIKRAMKLDCDFILTLNDDIHFGSDYVWRLLQDYFVKPPGSIIGSISLTDTIPRLITFAGVRKINYLLKEFSYFPKYKKAPENISGIYSSVVLSGRGILYPSATIKKIGLYDEKLVQYKSETDYTFRATKAGVPVFISYNSPVYENSKMTSSGAYQNKPSVKTFCKSLFNKYSINSIRMTSYYSIKHRGAIAGLLVCGIRISGLIKNFLLIKLKK